MSILSFYLHGDTAVAFVHLSVLRGAPVILLLVGALYSAAPLALWWGM